MGIVSLAQAIAGGPSRKTTSLTMVPVDSDVSGDNEVFSCQFWPETISESWSPQWVDKAIPGGSHPLKQWSASGGRTISFSIIIARDMRPKTGPDALPPALVSQGLDPSGVSLYEHNPDVRDRMRALRRFVLPTYEESSGVSMAKPPPVLEVNGGEIGWGQDGSGIIYAVVTGLSFSYQRLFENGTPRVVTADITLAEVVQRDGLVDFFDRSKML